MYLIYVVCYVYSLNDQRGPRGDLERRTTQPHPTTARQPHPRSPQKGRQGGLQGKEPNKGEEHPGVRHEKEGDRLLADRRREGEERIY